MNKFKKILLGTLSVLTLGLFVVTGTKVTAATLATTNFYSTTDTDVDNASDFAGWSGQLRSSPKSASNFNGSTTYYFATLRNDKGDYLQSPTLSYSDGTITECTVTVTINSAINDSNTADTYTVKGYSSANVELDTKNVETGTNKAFDTKACTLTSTSAIAYFKVFGLNTQNKKNFTIATIGAEYSAKYASSSSITATFESNGGSSVSAISIDTAGNITLRDAPTRTGYTFAGWKLGDDVYEASATYNLVSSVTFVAQWTANKYTVTYNTDGGTVANASKEVTYGSTYTLDTPTKTSNSFTGWYNGDNLVNLSGTWSIASDITVTARWQNQITSNYTYNVADELVNDNLGQSNYLVFTSCNLNPAKNGIKIESSTQIAFSLANSMKVTITINNLADLSNPSVKLNNGTSDETISFTSATVEKVLPAGNYIIKKGNAQPFISELSFENLMNAGISATTAAWQNSTKDSLRFVGTISGVSDLSTIDTIELVLLKNDVATKKQIFLNTCFISVSGVGSYTEIENTYYVVYRITGIDSTSMPDNTVIKHKLIVTFTDGSSVTSLVESSKWTN